MTLVDNYFDKLHTTNCNYREPLLNRSKMIIPTRNLGVMPGHPLNSTNELIYLPDCQLIFDKVETSKRELYSYTENPPGSKHFKASVSPHTISDGPFIDVDEPTTLFFVEGVMEDKMQEPLAWVDWEIRSVSFYLEVLSV